MPLPPQSSNHGRSLFWGWLGFRDKLFFITVILHLCVFNRPNRVVGLEQVGFVFKTKAANVMISLYVFFFFSGLIGSMFSILQFFSSPLTGAVSDCWGRRPVILLTVVCLVLHSVTSHHCTVKGTTALCLAQRVGKWVFQVWWLWPSSCQVTGLHFQNRVLKLRFHNCTQKAPKCLSGIFQSPSPLHIRVWLQMHSSQMMDLIPLNFSSPSAWWLLIASRPISQSLAFVG